MFSKNVSAGFFCVASNLFSFLNLPTTMDVRLEVRIKGDRISG